VAEILRFRHFSVSDILHDGGRRSVPSVERGHVVCIGSVSNRKGRLPGKKSVMVGPKISTDQTLTLVFYAKV
jgi:hypothetical protein